jgi:3-deoxy-D-manno-octulosonic-acid transferase
MANFQGAAKFVESQKLGERVQDKNELKARLEYWLSRGDARANLPDLSRASLAPHQGAPQRIAEHIAEKLKSTIANQISENKL